MMLRHQRPMARLLAAVLTCLLTAPALAAASTPTPTAVAIAAPAPIRVVNQHRITPVGPGITQTELTRFDALGWVRAQVLEVDLTNPAVSVDLLFSGAITGTESLSRAVTRTGAVAGINGDFYDIQETRAPIGAAVQAGQLLKSGHGGWETVVGVNGTGLGQMASLFLTGSVRLPGGEQPLASLNHYTVPVGGIGLYTPAWGSASRRGAADGAPVVRQVIVVNGVVTAVSEEVSDGPIPEGALLLIGREAGAGALAHLQIGDPVTISYGPSDPFRFAVGGSPVLLRGGQVQPVEAVGAHPRTAVGFSEDGSRLYLVVVEGRQTHSRGMTLLELARFMQELGAHDALNLDGGGSSAMAARQPGAPAAALVGAPAGGERAVANGIGLFVIPGSGIATGIRVESGGRTFPGLARQLTALPYDEAYARAVTGPISWSTTEGTITESGLFRAASSGVVTVTASAGGALAGTREIQVLGDLVRLETVPARLELQPGASATFTVIGYDGEGRSAPVDPADVGIASASGVTVTPNGVGFRLTAREAGPAVVSIGVQAVRTHLPVAVGTLTSLVSGFDHPAAWTGTASHGTVGASLTFTKGVTGQAAALAYDFTVGSGTRAAYLTAAPGNLLLPGRPTVLGMQVHGDGSGVWLRAQLRDARGMLHTINLADQVGWTGWRYIEQVLPANVSYPVSLWRIYPVETSAARQYTGTLLFDDLTVKGAPLVTLPPQMPVAPDPSARPAATWGDSFQPLSPLAPHQIRKGEAHSFDENGARIILLDAGTGSFRTAGYQQLVDLKRLLEEAEADEAVQHVILAAALPTTALTDPLEANLIEGWLAQFWERSGKGAAYLALAGAATGSRRVEGVIHVTASAEGPAQIGIGGGADWLRADLTPARQQVALTAPATVKVGARHTVAPGGIDLSYWSGVGIIFGAPHQTRGMEAFFVAAFNPATGELRAFKPGVATLRLRMGDVATEVTVRIEP